MTVLTGRSGQLLINGVRAARCVGWSLDESRPALDVSTVDSWDSAVIPGRRSGSGSAKVLYDPADTSANLLFDSVLANSVNEVPVTLLLDSAIDLGYPVTAHVSSVGHAVSRGEAQMRDISFRLTDVGIELEIIGNQSASQGITQPYTAAVYGLDGAWTYLWTTSGPTIADPTAQTTNVTFPTTGTFTLTVTATLGLTVLSDSITINVIETPLLMISRATYAQDGYGGTLSGLALLDGPNQRIYHAANSHADVSVAADCLTLSALTFTGTRLQTKRIAGTNVAGGEYMQSLYKLADNSIFMISVFSDGESRWWNVSSDLSAISYQFRSSAASRNKIQTTFYDSVTNKVFYLINTRPPISGDGGDTPYIGFIDASTGATTRYRIGMSPVFTTTRGSIIRTESGKILYLFVASNRRVFVECNTDLKAGGLPGPIRTIDHVFSYGAPNSGTLVETNNYIAVVSPNGSSLVDIHLYAKEDYAFVAGKSFTFINSGAPIAIYYSGGQFVIARASSSNGLRIARISEDLATVYSNDLVFPTATEAGPPWANNAPGFTVPSEPAGLSVPTLAKYDPGLGIMVTHAAQPNVGLTTGEMVMLFRNTYAGANKLAYGSLWMTINPDASASTSTALAITSTTNRSYTFGDTPEFLSLISTSLTIANDTALSFQSHVLTS